jgi:hypothetical protein
MKDNVMKILLKSIFCLFGCSAIAQTTIVYNISENTCSGTNMNCEGLSSGTSGGINAVGQNVTWDTSGSATNKLGIIDTNKEVSVFFTTQGTKTMYTLTPSAGTKKNKLIRVLFVKFPAYETAFKNIPLEVKNEVVGICKKQDKANMNSIIKVYRQFFSAKNVSTSEWVDVATLIIPQDAVDPQKINITPQGIATVTSTSKNGESVNVVIDLQYEY